MPGAAGVVDEAVDRAADERGQQQVVGRPALRPLDLRAARDRHAAAAVDLDHVLEHLRPRRGHARQSIRPTAVLGFAAMRLRTLTEAECYARCYGGANSDRARHRRAPPCRRDARRRARRGAAASASRRCSTSAAPRPRRHDARLPHLDCAAAATWSTPHAGRRRRCRARGSARRRGRKSCHAASRVADSTPSSVPDVLGPDLTCIFCGINPGRVSAAAAAHFANPRNDFWRLLHEAGFTPRLFEPSEQFSLLELGFGVTNAALRTTPGSGDLRQRRLRRVAARADRRRARPDRDRVRRQGGLPRHLQGAP